MENQFAPGSNTLLNVARLAAGYMLMLEFLPTAHDESGAPTSFAYKIKSTPLTASGKLAKSLPAFASNGAIASEQLDAEFTADIYKIFQGELAAATHREADYERALAEREAERSKTPVTNQETAAKTAAGNPPPTGRRAATADEIKLANEKSTPAAAPAKPGKPSKPGKPGITLVESSGTGENAPATPSAEAAPTQPAPEPATAAATQEPLVQDAVVVTEAEVQAEPEAAAAVETETAPHDYLAAAVADGWVLHPDAPDYHYKGSRVELTTDLEKEYPAPTQELPHGF